MKVVIIMNPEKITLLKILSLFVVFMYWTLEIFSQDLKFLTTNDGLASSAVTCVHQSGDGMLWFGTLDGVNVYLGERVRRAKMKDYGSLKGHIIEQIIETDTNNVWIQTAYGLYKLECLTKETIRFSQFSGFYQVRVAGKSRVMVLDADKHFYLYNTSKQQFDRLDYPWMKGEQIIDMGGTDEYCWIANNRGIYRYCYSYNKLHGVGLEQRLCLTDTSIKYCLRTNHPEEIYVVDGENCLYRLNICQNKMTFVFKLKNEFEERGIPTGIEKLGNSYFISFKVGGVLKYEYDQLERSWKANDLGVNSGVFGMLKDKKQNLLWIATDGQGVAVYMEGDYHVTSYLFTDFNHKIGKPVRALFMDEKGWLWIGTKGDGLLGIDRNEEKIKLFETPQRLFTSANSSLEDNSVYSLSDSRHNGFWVGTEKGLNFFSYSMNSLVTVPGTQDIEYVHAIKEVGDSILWISTVGKGVFKAEISSRNGVIQLLNVIKYDWRGGEMSSNFFFAMHHTDDGELWLGNRGYGLFQMFPQGLKPVAWSNKECSPVQNDVFTLFKHEDVLWVGTGVGLVRLGNDGQERIYDSNDGLPNDIVHAVQMDNEDGLWASTNNGVVRLDTNTDEMKVYGRRNGMRVTEFSDGASLVTGTTLYFGGVNGWVEIDKNEHYESGNSYVAPLYLLNYKGVDGNEKNLHLMNYGKEYSQQKTTIDLMRDENSFSISFIAMDYINAEDYRYYYKLDCDGKEDWIDNGRLNYISVVQMPPGDYKLSVKYRNQATGYESSPISIDIRINPYWWQTTIMKMVYCLIAMLIIAYVVIMNIRRAKRRHAYALHAMEQRHKEEVYEEKLRFFTNITHEFCTPLTLIYSPCERILVHPETNEFVRKYVSLIKKQTERLYSLIQEIIDYQRIETKHQQLFVGNYNISAYLEEFCTSIQDLTEKNEINLVKEIAPDLYWNMDKRCLPKIVNNLLSNAFKYTPKGGTIKVTLKKLSEDELQLRVYNTGKGIKEEDRERIFDRYSVLDTVESETKIGLLSRNGLGMAICHSTTLLLGGRIEIHSEVNEYAEFVVTLPMLPLSDKNQKAELGNVVPLIDQNREMDDSLLHDEPEKIEQGGFAMNIHGNLPLVLVVDDNKDILELLQETLSPYYKVRTALSAEEAVGHLRDFLPDLIITDVMMPGADGITLVKQIKHNKHTMHIPLVILSAHQTNEVKTAGLQAGADAYIGKPFNLQYLLAVVNRMLESRKDMHEYYSTSASAYSFMDGKLIKKEDKEFVNGLNGLIEANLYDSTLTTESIANALNMSTRSLYRRLKDLGLPFPKEYLRERRMEKAVVLLQTTDKSIQEIIYECGFNNRAHFYKEFGKRYQVTPKEYRNINKKMDTSLN